MTQQKASLTEGTGTPAWHSMDADGSNRRLHRDYRTGEDERVQLPCPARSAKNDRLLLQSLGVTRLDIYHRPADMRGLCTVPAAGPAHDTAGLGRLGSDLCDRTAYSYFG